MTEMPVLTETEDPDCVPDSLPSGSRFRRDGVFCPAEARAAEALPDAQPVIAEGAGHGFTGKDRIRVARTAAESVRDILLQTGPDVSAA